MDNINRDFLTVDEVSQKKNEKEKKQVFIKNSYVNFNLLKDWFSEDKTLNSVFKKTQLSLVDNSPLFLQKMKTGLKFFKVLVKFQVNLFSFATLCKEADFEADLIKMQFKQFKKDNNFYYTNLELQHGAIFLDAVKLLSYSRDILQDDYVFFHEAAHLLQVKQKNFYLKLDPLPLLVFERLFHSTENSNHINKIYQLRIQMCENFADLLGLYLVNKKHNLEAIEFDNLVYDLKRFRENNPDDKTHNTVLALDMALSNNYFNQPFENILEYTYRISLASTYVKMKEFMQKDVVFSNSVKKILMNLKMPEGIKSAVIEMVKVSNMFFGSGQTRDPHIYTNNNFNQLVAKRKMYFFSDSLEVEKHKLLDLTHSLRSFINENDRKSYKVQFK